MSEESVAQVEDDLGFTAQDTEVLKGVRLFWQKLLAARQKAIKDDKFLAQYRTMLQKGIDQARARQAPGSDEDVLVRSNQFWAWYTDQCREMDIFQKEFLRGKPHQAWCEKWLPKEWQAFSDAIGRVVDHPSQQYFEQAQEAALAMLRAYVSTIKTS